MSPMARSPRDWVLFCILVFLYGSAFMFIELSVETIPPLTVVASRLVLGAAFVYGWMRFQGYHLPPLSDATAPYARVPVSLIWLYFFVLAMIGNVLPFFLISWGQLAIESSLAGILMAFMPLATMMLAHFFVPGEPLTPAKIAGFVLGFLGVLVLMGPSALGTLSTEGARLAAQFAVLGGAFCYALNAIIARHAPRVPAIVSSTGILLIGALVSILLALVLERPWTIEVSTGALLAVIFLGIFTTALATVVYMELVQTAGPSFFALTNYLVPVLAVFLGALVLGEVLDWRAFAALALVLLGIFISQARITRALIGQIFSSPSK